ncbi:enoyl-CoA-hydratase DpgB [Streptomyces sp. NBC_00986]|uniref:enoyl-CoA-hydratase DpgB n=1 Tax=Streptomyces sp. NBC_00986 TaxID=2903702 RepID=UPI003866515B|nr:enoyl-CoA hydratase/isomerase family protein [Streptomyces sp. NBC_00986]
MMNADLTPTSLPDDLGFMVEVDGAYPLAELTAALNSICDQVERRGENSVLVLRLGTAPAETREWPGEGSVQAVNRWERAVRRLEQLSAVSIVVAQGTCSGPALDLLLAADFRIGTPDFEILLPVNDGHFWPGMSLFRLVKHVGLARARRIVLWGTDIALDEARELGLIDQVSDDVPDAVRTATVLTSRISDRETAVRRQLLIEAGTCEYDDALGAHLAACDRELRRLRRAGAAVGPSMAREL